MIAEKDATWEVEIRIFKLQYYWQAYTHDDTGAEQKKLGGNSQNSTEAKNRWKEYAALNGIINYKIIEE